MLSASFKDSKQGKAHLWWIGAVQTCVLMAPGVGASVAADLTPLPMGALPATIPDTLSGACMGMHVCVCVHMHAFVSSVYKVAFASSKLSIL